MHRILSSVAASRNGPDDTSPPAGLATLACRADGNPYIELVEPRANDGTPAKPEYQQCIRLPSPSYTHQQASMQTIFEL